MTRSQKGHIAAYLVSEGFEQGHGATFTKWTERRQYFFGDGKVLQDYGTGQRPLTPYNADHRGKIILELMKTSI